MSTKQVVVFTWVILLVLALGLAGCGTPQPTNSMALSIGQNSQAFSFFPFYVAQKQQFFKEQGLLLDPPVTIFGNGTRTTQAFEANSIEVAVGSVTDAFTVSRVDAYVTMIGAISNAFLIDVIVSKKFEQHTHLTERSPLAQKVKALLGAKIGISAPGSATDALLVYLFRQYGYNAQKDVTEVNLNTVTPTVALSALASGKVDAVSWPVPAGQEAALQGVGSIFISPVLGDVVAMQNMLYDVLYTRTDVIARKPKAINALLRGLAQAERFIHQHPMQALALLSTYLHLDAQTTKIIARAALSSVPASPQINATAYETANTFHVKAGLIAVPLAYKDLVATDTINKALGAS